MATTKYEVRGYIADNYRIVGEYDTFRSAMHSLASRVNSYDKIEVCKGNKVLATATGE